jgi:hypothetical protein
MSRMKQRFDMIALRLLLWALTHGSRWRKARITYTLGLARDDVLLVLNFTTRQGDAIECEATGGPFAVAQTLIAIEKRWM